MIEIKGMTRKYGEFTAVNSMDLTIEGGTIFGLLGPNGAGKSTTVKIITGAIKPTEGSVLINGKEISKHPEEVKAAIGYIPENAALFKNLTGKEYLTLTGRLYHVQEKTLKNRINSLLERFHLDKEGDHQIHSYSKGMVQKLLIISALIHNPDILILDEPLNGLDASSAAVFKEILRSFTGQGKTILLSTHILEIASNLCGSLAILFEGKILIKGTVPEILEKTGRATLEEAFIHLTGKRDIQREAQGILAAMKKEES